MPADPDFKPALIVVDLQEDFCPPNGALAVASGRDVIPVVNALLRLQTLVTRIATKDWHPADHVSFASNHAGKRPFVDFCKVVNPYNAEESYETRLWPAHCVQGTSGAELVPELEVGLIDKVIEKGTDPRVEMYSAFYAPFTSPRVSDSGLKDGLREEGITDVYVVGLAGDYCVKNTALDAAAEGFRTFVVEEGTRAVDAVGWEDCRREIERGGVKVVSVHGPEVGRLTGGSELQL
ncbi:Isochorismatase hydrolase [Coniochaeta ligniaria NRRL 30616]|uniref:nicotinamidase n=1 Tax=Coniochaeta ligniaria NRRL 30616 TaxID=1408157 RepID=A0A1J7IS68_9PEZI|nr:Isochorismatase hydrolase [Coniochaeta ligniaria NRRL 30616]